MTTKTKTKLAVFLPAEGSPRVLDLLSNGDTLKSLQVAVGGYVQAVSLAQGFEGLVMWVNEEAKLIQGLPYNELATQIWRESFRGYAWGSNDYILGNAVFTLEADSEGDTMGMPQEVAERFAQTLEKLADL